MREKEAEKKGDRERVGVYYNGADPHKTAEQNRKDCRGKKTRVRLLRKTLGEIPRTGHHVA